MIFIITRKPFAWWKDDFWFSIKNQAMRLCGIRPEDRRYDLLGKSDCNLLNTSLSQI